MSTKTKYGRQPIYSVLRRQRWTFAALSRETGVSLRALLLSARGETRPNADIRRLVPPFLGVSLEDLYSPDAIEHMSRHGAGGWGTTRQTKKGR